MKVVVITICILVLFFVGCLFFSNYVEKGCHRLLVPIEALTEALLRKDWQQAEASLEKIFEIWDEYDKVWGYLLEHEDLNRIETAMSKLKLYTSVEEQMQSLGEVVELKMVIKIIEEKEGFILEKLF